MTAAFDGIWSFARVLTAFAGTATKGRKFLGFLEPLRPAETAKRVRTKAGFLPRERFRLLAEPKEDFSGITRLVCGGDEFEILSVQEVYLGNLISHRECILKRTSEVSLNA
ncbi:MAG: hypothetical protein RR731_03395 [Oscillospiraceae bacterium]